MRKALSHPDNSFKIWVPCDSLPKRYTSDGGTCEYSLHYTPSGTWYRTIYRGIEIDHYEVLVSPPKTHY